MSMSEYLLKKYKKLSRRVDEAVQETESVAGRIGIVERLQESTRDDVNRSINDLEERMATNIERIETAVEGIRGDVNRLTTVNEDLRAKLAAAGADKDAAVADALAAQDAALGGLADKLAALDAENEETPAPVEETPVEETPEVPVETPAEETPAEVPVEETPAPAETPVDPDGTVEPRADQV